MRDGTTDQGIRVGAEPSRPANWLDTAHAFAPRGFERGRAGVCLHRFRTVLYLCSTTQSLFGIGLGRGAAVLGVPVLDLVSSEDRGRVEGAIKMAAREGHSTSVRATFSAPGGTAVSLEVIASSLLLAAPPVDVLYLRAAEVFQRNEAGVFMESREAGEARRAIRQPGILICDDESRLSALTAGLLVEFGFRPVTAGTGEDALERLGEASPSIDVVLLDVNLTHGRSARDVLASMRSIGNKARVILTSGLAAEDVDPDLLSHPSVVGYIAKPYAVEVLVESIREALRLESLSPFQPG